MPSVTGDSLGKRAETSGLYFSAGRSRVSQINSVRTLLNISATPAMPIHPGALSPCGHYYHVLPGDTVCLTLRSRKVICPVEANLLITVHLYSRAGVSDISVPFTAMF